MRRALSWIGWIGWALALVLTPLIAGRAVATVWAWVTWPLIVGPASLYPAGSVSDGKAFAAAWMTWSGLGWTVGLLVLLAGAFAFGATRLPVIRRCPRGLLVTLACLLLAAQAAYWSFEMIRTDPYWDVFIVVPE